MMKQENELYYGPPDAQHFCSRTYKHPGRRCPNFIDFYVKDQEEVDWSTAQAACVEHLAEVIWSMQDAGHFIVRVTREKLPAFRHRFDEQSVDLHHSACVVQGGWSSWST